MGSQTHWAFIWVLVNTILTKLPVITLCDLQTEYDVSTICDLGSADEVTGGWVVNVSEQ